MKVLVDTDVWSESLRKREGKPSDHVLELRNLIQEGRVQLIGFIRMEVLSGIREKAQFDRLHSSLKAFPDKTLSEELFVMAARFFNLCRSKGIQGSNYDFLLCACSVSWRMPILSKDKDFQQYKKHLPIELLHPRLFKHGGD